MNWGNVLDPFNIRGAFQDPSRDAQRYLSQVPGQLEKYMGFYNDAGRAALPMLQGQYGSLLNDPGGRMNQIGASFQQSPGFKFAMDQALGASGRAAAAGGMAGSPMHSQQNMELATNLANQDYNNWIQRALGLYGRGLSGQENLYGIGAQTGREMGSDMATNLMNQANLSMVGNVARNQNVMNLLGGGARFGLAAWNPAAFGFGGGS